MYHRDIYFLIECLLCTYILRLWSCISFEIIPQGLAILSSASRSFLVSYLGICLFRQSHFSLYNETGLQHGCGRPLMSTCFMAPLLCLSANALWLSNFTTEHTISTAALDSVTFCCHCIVDGRRRCLSPRPAFLASILCA